MDAFASRGVLRVSIERAEGILVEHLLDRGESVFCISPKISARARERYRVANTKSDAFDAFVLADTLRHEHVHWRPLSRPSALTAQIAALSRDRERVIVMQRAVESRLRAALEAYHPAPLHLFSSLDRDITLAFIRDYPTPAAAARVTEDRMRRFCARHGYTGRVEPAALCDRLRPHLLTATDGTITGKHTAALMLVDQLELLNTNIRTYNAMLTPLVSAHPDGPVFTSFPGIATVIAATMIGEMGDDRARFPTAATLLAEAGLAPVTRASGRTRQVRFRYAANKRLRHSIDWWMTVAAREDPWSGDVYEHARNAGQGRYRAYRGLGARWTRILWRAWTDHEPFDPTRVHHQAPAA
ncbi:IS110 family transposase [Rudaeicoccus suwonensis]|uniref:IS110 family transposase n=1 Tax=Rudaeicoccus suwonensis TaxID=657409 RepID=UPI00248269E3|nr:transposase [Rudaeicoccus suwonensis]